MNVYTVHATDGEQVIPLAAFSALEYAQAFIRSQSAQCFITEWTVDEKLPASERHLNKGILLSKPWQDRPREECLLTGDASKRGKVEGFDANLSYALRETFRATAADSAFEQVKAERLLAESGTNVAVAANGHPRYESLFSHDNFTSRRTTGHNLLDPESFITQDELDKGYTFTNSYRDFPDQATYERACRGYLTLAEVVEQGPRVFIAPKVSGKKSVWSVAQEW